VKPRRLPILLAGAALSLGLAACHKEAHPHVAENSEGTYVDAGPITYQVQLSRALNPFNIEDKQYLVGIPAGTVAPTPAEEWFAIWLWAKNQTGVNHTTARNFDLVDTQGTHYDAIPVDAAVNPFTWTPQILPPLGTEPAPNSAASTAPTQGATVLFKINLSAYANRPVKLEIRDGARQVLATVTLDL
jgi:hypothetical protein